MKAPMRIKHLLIVTFSTLSGCSFFEGSVQTCNEPQEYQDSISVPALIVPDALQNLQDRSVFNIPDVFKTKSFNQKKSNAPKITNNAIVANKTINKIENIEDSELSELLGLIDQTIEYRTLTQSSFIYDSSVIDSDVEESLGPCTEDPPNYFAEGVMPRSMPSQAYSKSSNRSREVKEEKSWWQKRKEVRQQRKTDKQKTEQAEKDTSPEDAEEDKEKSGETLIKNVTSAVIGLYTGGSFGNTTLSGGKRIAPLKPSSPDDEEIIDEADPTVIADKVRDLALLDGALNDEQRIFIQNMTDEQILEMVGVIMNQTQNQDTGESTTTDGKIVNKADKNIVEEEKSWWQKQKEDRQQRRVAKQAQKD